MFNNFYSFVIIMFLVFVPAIAASNDEQMFDPFNTEIEAMDAGANAVDLSPLISNVQLDNNEISMAFQIISDKTGWNIFPTDIVCKKKISFWASTISAEDLFETVVMLAGFTYHREGDLITVMTYEEYAQHYRLVKEVFTLQFANAGSIAKTITPFMTEHGKCVVHNETNAVVLYEVEANLKSILPVIEKLDTPAENILVEVFNLKYADCEDIAGVLSSVFAKGASDLHNKSASEDKKSEGGNDQVSSKSQTITVPDDAIGIYAVSQSNQLVVVGTDADIEKAKGLVGQLDIYGDNMVLDVVDLEYADAELLGETLMQLFGQSEQGGAKGVNSRNDFRNSDGDTKNASNKVSTSATIMSPQSSVYVQAIGRTNQLIIKAFPVDLEKMKGLIKKLDMYTEPTTRSYHLEYIDAAEVQDGLEEILNLRARSYSSSKENEKKQGLVLVERTNTLLLTGPPSSHRIMISIMEEIDNPATFEAGTIRIYKLKNADVEEVFETISEIFLDDNADSENAPDAKLIKGDNPDISDGSDSQQIVETERFVTRVQVRLSKNVAKNSIVIKASPSQHRQIEMLIKELDTRNKQVLIKAMIVEITITDDLNLGVELSHVADEFLAFSSYGLSTNLIPTTGTRDITVSPGGTSAILSPDKVSAIIQALKKDTNTRVTSAPEILVNDNAVGYINSVAEAPYTRTDQGQTSTTTSFGGFVEAGTQFALTPHISEGDHLRLEYEITLNSFTAKPSLPSIPPPRSTTSIQSEATIPQGHTIVVGGLQSAGESESVNKVPLLGDIPLIGGLFKSTSIEKQNKTTYLFITPYIMESDDFSDLKEVSEQAIEEVEPRNRKDGKRIKKIKVQIRSQSS